MTASFFQSDLFLLTATVGFYCLGSALHRRTGSLWLHPVLLAFVAMIGVLNACGVEYARYREATALLDFGLGLAVVSLGYLMYEQLEQIRAHLVPLLVSSVVGCVLGVLSVVYIAGAFGAERRILTSLAPKSVTVPIAVAVAEPLGGIVPLTSVVVFCVGLFGSMVGEWVLRRSGVRDPLACGFALGSAAHGIGTARAVRLGAAEGALAGVAMALMGLATALLLPLMEKFLY